MKASEDSTLLHGTLAAPPRRGPPALVALIGLAAVAASVATFAARARATAPEQRLAAAAALPGQGDDDAGLVVNATSGWLVRDIDLRRHASVRKFLRGQNITDETDENTLLEYVPRLQARLKQGRVDGAFGAQAASGYVTFNLMGNGAASIGWDSARRTAGYLVVMTLGGELVAVRPCDETPTTGLEDDRADDDDGHFGKHSRWSRVFYNALKMRDPHRVLLGANYGGDNGNGPVQMWDWTTDELHTLGDSLTDLNNTGEYTSHDLQFVSAHDYAQHLEPYLGRDSVAEKTAATTAPYNGSDDRIWRPDLSANEIYAVDAESGATVRQVGPFDWRTNDINHFQVLGDGTAIINGRVSGAFRKVELATGRTLWICGGHYGNFTIIDLNGTHWEPGWKSPHPKFLFDGQHNLEYFGNGEYLMFDNAYNEVNVSYIEASSRPMRLQLDEQNFVATITWAFETGVHSTVYGDADLLPTGHVLACYWPSQLSSTMENQFDARMVEVIPREAGADASEDEVAWELLVHGHRCTEPPPTGCSRSQASEPIGWSVYSVERFYLSPMAHSVTVRYGDDDAWFSELCLGDANSTREESKPRDDDAWTADDDATTARRALAATTDDDASNASLTLEFVAVDSIKSNFIQSGTWRLEQVTSSVSRSPEQTTITTEVIAHGDITFQPHWRPTTVKASLSSDITKSMLKSGSWQLSLQDQWGYHSRVVPLSCD